MQDSGRAPVKFDRPPVLEVACGVAFVLPRQIKTAHIGLYWSRVAAEFPRCEDAPPIAMVVEGQSVPDTTEYSVQFEQVVLPPMRRAWLLNQAGTHLIQLQDDRFLFNWKRTSPDLEYPSYRSVVAGFWTEWKKYKAFLAEQGLGEPTPTQLEMTYFNMLGGAEELRDFVQPRTPGRFLPQPEAVNYKTLYTMPQGGGRLHVSAASARHVLSGEKGIRLDITARGLPKNVADDGCASWFDLAHEWITHGFADFTTDEAHKNWGRTA